MINHQILHVHIVLQLLVAANNVLILVLVQNVLMDILSIQEILALSAILHA